MSMELLAPAGDLERLRMAVAYGADAVYLAGTSFGMRAFAGNFNPDELREAVKLCHTHGVKVHVADQLSLGLGAVYAHVHNDLARRKVSGVQYLGPAQRGDYYVRAPCDVREPPRVRVAHRDGGVGAHEQHGHRTAYDQAAAHHDGVPARGLYAVVFQQRYHRLGGTGREALAGARIQRGRAA